MKKIISSLLIIFLFQLSYSQNDFYKEFDYNNFVGTFYSTGGDGIKITYNGTSFRLTDLTMGEEGETFKGYPDNGRIKYYSGNDKEYIGFSKDYTNVIIYSWGNEFINTQFKEKIPRKKALSLADLNTINKFTGNWKGKTYPGTIYECKIYISDNNKLIYQDVLNNLNCELTLINDEKLTGSIQYKDETYIDKFELTLNGKDKLMYNSYDMRIDFVVK